jgi:hypothetical protein
MNEANELVEDLNVEWYETTGNDEWQPFELRSCGADYAIMFCGWPLFQSGADYLDDEAGESLRDFVLIPMKDMLRDLFKLKCVFENK